MKRGIFVLFLALLTLGPSISWKTGGFTFMNLGDTGNLTVTGNISRSEPGSASWEPSPSL
ncbi:MAG: hypothetical protein ACI83O_000376 [Patescibacteria group bacterium]|jgi:hypothetical protein